MGNADRLPGGGGGGGVVLTIFFGGGVPPGPENPYFRPKYTTFHSLFQA